MQGIDFTLNKTTLDEAIADKLEEIILRDAAQIEQKLPSEHSLAISFGVSRTVIREALRILKARGLITSQNGVGSCIRKPDPSSVTDAINRIIQLENIDSMAIFEARTAIEIMVARLAADKATPADCDSLDVINRQLEVDQGDLDKRSDGDLLFHLKLAAIAGNPIICLFMQSLGPMIRPLMRAANAVPRASEDGILYHQRIIEALRTGNISLVEDLMRSHMVTSYKNYEASLEISESSGSSDVSGSNT